MTKEIKVALCDDEKQVYVCVEKLIKRYEEEHQVCFQMDYYSDAGELLEVAEQYELILLDIEMPQMSGIEFGQALLHKKYNGKIIMLSGMVERFKETFKIQAYRFVSKPIEEEELFSALTDFLGIRIGRNVFKLHRGKDTMKVQEREICCILSEDSSTVVFTEKESFRSEKALREWEEILEKQMFFRCHRQAVVNLGYIKRLDKDITLINGDKVPVSRRKRKELKEKYVEYELKYR